MHRLFAPFLAIAVLLAVLAPVPGHAADADNKGIKLDFDAAVLQRMSAFLSAFSEVDPQGRWHRIDDAAQADPQWLVTFGVLHNWMHNAPAFVVDGGQASIDATAVAATIEEYTGLKFDGHVAVPESGIGFADGRYSIAADTPREGPQAVVVNVYVTPDNQLIMGGHVADKRPADGQDDLQVRVAHHTWKGKDCWKLLTWAWTGKPEAKPVEQPTEEPAEQAVEQPAEQPVPQPAEHQAGQGTEQTAEQPKVESAPESQPEPVAVPAVQPETESAPVAEPAPADKPADTSAVTPETETAPAPQNGSQAAPEAKPEPQAEQPAQESAPATPSETETPSAVEPAPQPGPVDNTPAAEPETQPEPEATPAPQPVTEPVAEATPETPATAAAEPTTPEATAEAAVQPQTVIPFTASTEPDFSEVLAIAVPAGWNHRNAEGVLELTPEAEDAWLVVEAVRLGKRDPQKALKVFSGGAELTPYGTGGASFIFSSEGSTGHREHMIVVDADANLICRLTWQATEAHRDAIAAILHGLRVNGRAVAG